MNGNNNYYLVTCVKQQSAQNNTLYFRCVYSNGTQELYRVFKHGQDIPTIIYDRE